MGSFDGIPMLMTPQQTAAVTGEHVGSIRRGINEGRIPADKVNGRWLISRDIVFPNLSDAHRRAAADKATPDGYARV